MLNIQTHRWSIRNRISRLAVFKTTWTEQVSNYLVPTLIDISRARAKHVITLMKLLWCDYDDAAQNLCANKVTFKTTCQF